MLSFRGLLPIILRLAYLQWSLTMSKTVRLTRKDGRQIERRKQKPTAKRGNQRRGH